MSGAEVSGVAAGGAEISKADFELDLACRLIERPSVTPDDAGCQDLLSGLLEEMGFSIRRLPFENVQNIYAVHGSGNPHFCFLGHTDVVPAGETSAWESGPFKPSIRDGLLYGRGAADMKGCIAAFIAAVRNFLSLHKTHKGSLAIILSSDEEGIALHGTKAVIEKFEAEGKKIDYCLVGEPSSEDVLGDVIKVGRRGSLSGKLRVKGVQGHVAYPHLASNPVHKALPALHELCQRIWDEGNEFFPASSFQISNCQAGTGADNVIPGHLDLIFNFRYSSSLNADGLKAAVGELLDKHGLEYELEWRHSGLPFLTQKGALLEALVSAIKELGSIEPRLSTAGGTSDGRFVAPTGAQVVEFGLINRSIHKVNEHASVADLKQLALIYERVLEKILL